MSLDYLDFDYSEDEHGHGSFDAMAAVRPAQWPALQREVMQVLAWAEESFGPPGGSEEAAWDCELQGVQEVSTPLRVAADLRAGQLSLEPGTPGEPRITLSLTLTGGPQFCGALREAFGLD